MNRRMWNGGANRRQRGFTLIELLVVIVVIGILAGITMIGANRFQMEARDARRAASISVITESLEKYYDQNGEYPNCGSISVSGVTVSTNTLKGIETSALIAPGAPSGTTNSVGCSVSATVSNDVFQYISEGSPACTNNTGGCLRFALRYKSESENIILQLTSRRR